MTGRERSGRRAKNRLRGSPTKKPKRVLIVTEGQITEKEYFEALIRRLGIVSDVEVRASGGASPTSVVKVARDAIMGNRDYNRIFCVIDRDDHGDYDSALKEIDEVNSSIDVEVVAIPSFPSFEYWLYLHSKYSTKPYSSYGSPAGEMIKDLKKIDIFEGYDKSIPESLFNYLYENYKDAFKHAVQALDYARKDINAKEYHEDPSTRIHSVVENLKQLAQRRAR